MGSIEDDPIHPILPDPYSWALVEFTYRSHPTACGENKGTLELPAYQVRQTRGGMTQVYDDQKEMDAALGTGRQEYGLLSVWWD